MKKNSNTKFILFLISYVIVYSIMPVVNRLTSRYLTTYGYLVIVLLLFLLIIAGRGRSFNTYISLLLPMIGYQLLTAFTNTGSWVMWGYRVLLFLLPAILGYFLIHEAPSTIPSMGRLLVACLLITAITTIIGAWQYPSAARYLATVASPDDSLAVQYSMRNIAGYDFVYTVVLLYPMLIYAYKTKRINTVFTVTGSLIALAVILYTEYTTALLLYLVTTGLFFVKKDLKAKDIRLLLLISILFIILFDTVIANLLRTLSNSVQSTDVANRLEALAGGKKGMETAEDDRIWRYQQSLQLFFSHPLLGTLLSGGRGSGGHSAILDSLARFGLLGAVLVYCIYKRVYRVFFLPFQNSEGYGYYYWLFLQAILLSIINTGFWLGILVFYAPILFLWINNNNNTIKVNHESTMDS